MNIKGYQQVVEPGCLVAKFLSRFNTQFDAISTHQGVVDQLVGIYGGLHQLPEYPRMVEHDQHLAQLSSWKGDKNSFDGGITGQRGHCDLLTSW